MSLRQNTQTSPYDKCTLFQNLGTIYLSKQIVLWREILRLNHKRFAGNLNLVAAIFPDHFCVAPAIKEHPQLNQKSQLIPAPASAIFGQYHVT